MSGFVSVDAVAEAAAPTVFAVLAAFWVVSAAFAAFRLPLFSQAWFAVLSSHPRVSLPSLAFR